MSIDLAAATDFMATHASVPDRRRFELLGGRADASAALAALDGYRTKRGSLSPGAAQRKGVLR